MSELRYCSSCDTMVNSGHECRAAHPAQEAGPRAHALSLGCKPIDGTWYECGAKFDASGYLMEVPPLEVVTPEGLLLREDVEHR